MKNRIIIFLSLLLMMSCGDIVRFEAPQPEGISNERKIPKRLIGNYSCLNDSSTMTITDRFIIKCSITSTTGRLDSIDRKTIKRDTVFSGVDNKVNFDIVVKGDSIFQRFAYYDTIFDALRGDIVRKYKGHYFLNEEVSPNSWRVTTLAKVHNGLVAGTISTKDDINHLRELTETKSDSGFRFRPTRKEFKKFVKENGFSDRDTYVKLN